MRVHTNTLTAKIYWKKYTHIFLGRNYYIYTQKSWAHSIFKLRTAHIEIFIILIKLIFQNIFFNKFCGISPTFYGGVITFAVEVWSWKLCQMKDPLALAPRSTVLIVLHIKTKQRAVERDDQTIIQARCFDSENRGLQHQRPMDL